MSHQICIIHKIVCKEICEVKIEKMNSYVFKSPIGLLKICEKKGKLTNLYLLDKESKIMFPQDYVWHSDLLYETYKQINEYFDGKRTKFDLPINCEGTPFQQQVWKELQGIPYGETRSYKDIAIGIGNPKAVRAVGQANNKNPIMIIVPCHRVIHTNGDITGFGCGTEVKKYLLDLEKNNR